MIGYHSVLHTTVPTRYRKTQLSLPNVNDITIFKRFCLLSDNEAPFLKWSPILITLESEDMRFDINDYFKLFRCRKYAFFHIQNFQYQFSTNQTKIVTCNPAILSTKDKISSTGAGFIKMYNKIPFFFLPSCFR